MPWFPDFANAAELARKQTRAAGRADPVGQYFAALNRGETHDLEITWPGEVVVYDPRAGEIRGHGQLRRFVKSNKSWLAQRHARIETVASTSADGRAVVEMLAHLDACHSPRRGRASFIFCQQVQRGRGYRLAALRGDRRRGALCAGVQLRPLGQP